MYTYRVLICVNGNRSMTQWVQLQADNDYICQQLAESMYGNGNILTYTRV
jgi:hypothetical protein